MPNQRCAPGWSSSRQYVGLHISLFCRTIYNLCYFCLDGAVLGGSFGFFFSLTVDFGLVMLTYLSGNQYKLGKLRFPCAEAKPDLGLLLTRSSKALLRAAHVLLSRVFLFFPIAAACSLYFSHSNISLIQKRCLNFIYYYTML